MKQQGAAMLNDEELTKLLGLVGPDKTLEEVSEAMGMHRTTLERRLLKEHELVLESTRGSRVVTLAEYRARKAQEAEPQQEKQS